MWACVETNRLMKAGDDVGLYPALNLELPQFLPSSFFLECESSGCRPNFENSPMILL